MLSYKQTLWLSAIIGLEIGIAFWMGYGFGYIEGEFIEKAYDLGPTNPNGPDGPGGEEVNPTRDTTKEGFRVPLAEAARREAARFN